MKALSFSACLTAAVLVCPSVLAAVPPGWVVGWGENVAGAATGTAPVSSFGPQWNVTGTVRVAVGLLTNVIAVSAGDSHSLALTARGDTVAWGANDAGDTPYQVANGIVTLGGRPLMDVIAVAAGRTDVPGFSLALLRDGRVVGWGDNRFGQIAIPGGLSNVVGIAAGSFQGLALRADGTVLSWGRGNPPPLGLSNVVAISAGEMYGQDLALTRDGRVVDWPVRSARYVPTVPPGLSNVVAVSAGWNHSLALRGDRTVIGWGFNDAGQATGDPSPPGQPQATGEVRVAGQVLTNVIAIAAAHEFSLALKADGSMSAWGKASGVPISPPAGLTNVVAISASGYYCLAITTNEVVAARFLQPPPARQKRGNLQERP
jgi:alpha-tubulin suppressor-like RCC1 family protein